MSSRPGFRLDLLATVLEGEISMISMAKCLATLRLFTTTPTAMPISAALGRDECLLRSRA
jgi:hypothetical protein